MSKIIVNKLNITNACENIEQADTLLENTTDKIAINTINWKDYAYLPKVDFRIAHTDNEIILKYYVVEKNPKALEDKINGNVYKDSCVEFFISPNSNGFYYNFEFNCIGTPHIAYGKDRFDRQLLDIDIVNQIKIFPTLGTKPLDLKNYNKEWSILIIIPKSVMIHDQSVNWNALNTKANFYKCGDETDEMHFVTWKAVNTPKPDYHQYSFFGDLFFQ